MPSRSAVQSAVQSAVRSAVRSALDYPPARLLNPPKTVIFLKTIRGVQTTENTMRQWRHEGRGPVATVIAGRILYSVEDLNAWVDEQIRESRDSHRRAASARL